ncbi:MAG: tRNA (adenosine(37)-N6)-threonylcarbamoyltransferase complex transferase subunit TsaD, partial [Candidatus Omnitrophota bacterium]|nr:tRNA (adenosine(37)-N6)-threonylcarbamoyltransferase complex transferase subunit TsaD [Candidatus Omnitrophota bacterium]
EAFDKVAKLLGLGYPGGPVVEKAALASKGVKGISFPRSYLGKDSLDFSFSGLKTAVLYYVRDRQDRFEGGGIKEEEAVKDVCRAFQEAVLDVLVEKAILACDINKIKRLVVGGGVAANSLLRKKSFHAAKFAGVEVHFPEMRYCTDNAAMIGFLGEGRYRKGYRSSLYMSAEPNLEVSDA